MEAVKRKKKKDRVKTKAQSMGFYGESKLRRESKKRSGTRDHEVGLADYQLDNGEKKQGPTLGNEDHLVGQRR